MDSIYLLLYALPFALLGFIFEAYPRFLNRYCGVDIWTHLLYLQEYKKQKGIPGKIEQGFLVPGKYDYPPAFIFILSKFPIEMVKKYEFLFSPVFDSIFMIMTFMFAYSVTQNIFIAFLTQLFYLLTPIIILENSSATPRSLGYTLFTITFFSLFLFGIINNLWLIVIAVIAGTFIFLSHRFTTQAYLFFSIIFSIITFKPIFIFVFAISFLIAIILSKGFYLTVLKGHLGNLKFWRENIKYRFAHQVRGLAEQHKTNDFVFRLYNQFLRFPPFVLAITNPWVLSALYLYFFIPQTNMIITNLAQLVFFSYIISLATTWIPQGRFLGEGQRYLELSAFPSAFLSAIIFYEYLSNPYILIIFILVGLAAFITIIVIQRKAIIKDKLRTLTPNLKIMFNYLRSLKKKPRLLVIPHQMTTSTIYNSGCPVFVNADYATIEKISDVYPFLKKPVKQIMDKYNLDLILLNEDYAKKEELNIKKYQIIKEVENYLLIKPQ